MDQNIFIDINSYQIFKESQNLGLFDNIFKDFCVVLDYQLQTIRLDTI